MNILMYSSYHFYPDQLIFLLILLFVYLFVLLYLFAVIFPPPRPNTKTTMTVYQLIFVPIPQPATRQEVVYFLPIKNMVIIHSPLPRFQGELLNPLFGGNIYGNFV